MKRATLILSLILTLGGCASNPETSIFVALVKERPIGQYGDWTTNVGSIADEGLVTFSFVDSVGDLDSEVFAGSKARLYVTESNSKPYVTLIAEIDSETDPLMRISRSNWREKISGQDLAKRNAVMALAEFSFELNGLTLTRPVRCSYLKGGQWLMKADEVSEIIHHLNRSSSVSIALSLNLWGDRFDVTLAPIKFNTAGVTHFETMQIPASALN